MRILHVSERTWPMGGAERLLHDTCSALQQQGHEVTALVADDSVQGPSPTWAHWRLPRTLGPRPAWPLKARLDTLLAGWPPDVVHLHNTQNFLSPLLLAHLQTRRPTLRYVHDARLVCPRSPSKTLPGDGGLCTRAMGPACLRHCFPWPQPSRGGRSTKELALLYSDLWLTRRLPAVAVGSRYMWDLMISNGVPERCLHLLPGFTTLQPGPPPEPGHLLAVGRFDGAKGLESLPTLLAQLRAPDWQATVVGSGPQLDATQRQAQQLGLAGRIHFVPALDADELAAHYARASVVLFPTQVPEAFGLVGIEALARGRPVVAYRLGGVGEWLHDGLTGHSVPPGHAEAFAARVDELLLQPRRAAAMGAAGLTLVNQRFRPEHHLGPLFRLYQHLARQAAPA